MTTNAIAGLRRAKCNDANGSNSKQGNFSFVSVNLFRIEDLDADFLPVIARQFIEKTGSLARVAGRFPDLLYFYQNRVFVAIGIKGLEFLHIARFLALFP